MTKDQLRERTMEKFAVMVHHVTSEPLDVFDLRMQVGPAGAEWLVNTGADARGGLAAYLDRRPWVLDAIRRGVWAVLGCHSEWCDAGAIQ